MRAVVFDQPGPPGVLHVAEVADPEPGEHDVLIEVHACALNRADLLQRRGLYPPPPGASAVLGLECAGIVVRAGAATSTVRPGDRVMALLPGGGYAEKVAIHERLTLPVPAKMPLAHAAGIPEAFLTAQEALLGVGQVARGETVLIHAAASGVGAAAVELAGAIGARVIATAGNSDKCALARELGAHHTIEYKQEDFATRTLELTEQRGADVIIDFVGAAYAEAHSRCLANGGRHVVVGLLGGSKANVDFGKLLSRRQSISGMVMRTRSLADKVAIVERFRRNYLSWFDDGRLRPVIDSIVPLEEADRAHERMEQNLNQGKIVLELRRPAIAAG
jgi:tumor protein p53-inducible protein 3